MSPRGGPRGPSAGALAEEERRVLEALSADSIVALLEEWIPLRSLGGQESPAQEAVARRLEAAGLETDVWAIDFAELRRHPAYSAEVERDAGLGVVGRLPGRGGGRSLILNGHVDVVPIGDESAWTRPPWRASVEEDAVYGRGACDMKGGLACALVAARAIREAGVALAGDLLIQSVIGEEDGGCGTLAASLRGYRADGAVIAEPTSLAIAPAQAGALNFRLRVSGRAAHASVRDQGVSAIEKAVPLLEALADLERRINAGPPDPLFERWAIPYPLSVGRLVAGDWASTVPDRLVCEGRLGVAPGEETAAARRRLEEAVADAARRDPWLARHPPAVEWWGGQFEPASIPADHPLVATLSGALADAGGGAARVHGVPYGSDLRHLVRVAETPAVLFGPGDLERAHAADECVPLAELLSCARALALHALRFCGVAEHPRVSAARGE